MVRVKIPWGGLTASQLDRLADVAERTPRRTGHVTTRQNVQFHFVPLADVPDLMRSLAEVGLTTREACGNTVRNVTIGHCAGDRKSTRLNSSHSQISYAVFCL